VNNPYTPRSGSARARERATDQRAHGDDSPVPDPESSASQDADGMPVSDNVTDNSDDITSTTTTTTTTGAPAGETPESVRQQRDEYYDLLLRKTAEFDNYRRRIERERRDLSDFASADVLKSVIPLVDDLERALQAAASADDAALKDPRAAIASYRAGVELIHKQLLDILRKKGVTPIDSIGKDFDPHVHQAVTQEVSDEHREGEVMQELARGYKLGDRLLRPAMVKVATRG
jgi:molecular chaperone GrpE